MAQAKMVSKAKKEAPAPPKAETKAKNALKAKKMMLKGIHSHKKKIHTHVTHLPVAQNPAASEAPKTPLKE